jgi:putative transposase
MRNVDVENFNGRMREELLDDTRIFSMYNARVEIATWVVNYNQDRQPLSLGYESPAAFAVKMDK